MPFLKNRWFITIIIILIVMGWFVFSKNKSDAKYIETKRGRVISEVSITGKVKPIKSLDLAFEKSGRISRVLVGIGDRVYTGQALIILDNTDIAAQLAQAKASVKIQQAKLDDLKKGTRIEDLNVKEAELKKAQEDLRGYLANAINILNDAYSKSDDAVRTKTSNLFINGESDNPTLNTSFIDSQGGTDAKAQRLVMRNMLNSWYADLQTISAASSKQVLEDSLQKAQSDLSLVRNFINKITDLLNGPNTFSQAALDTYKASMSTAITNINTASASVASQIQSINTQGFTVEKIQNELNLKLAGNTLEDIAAQEAQIEQAQANVLYYQSQLDKTVLLAPFDGIITKSDKDPGEIMSANSTAISLIGSGKFEIEAFIAESDTAKIKIGETAKTTLDAYGPNVEFNAKIISRDLAETVIEGVATYKIVLLFDGEDERILPGLTANVDILVDKKDDVLYIPTRNILDRNGEKIVKLVTSEKNGAYQEIKISTGLRGSDGRTEILFGISDGQKILAE